MKGWFVWTQPIVLKPQPDVLFTGFDDGVSDHWSGLYEITVGVDHSITVELEFDGTFKSISSVLTTPRSHVKIETD
jgi:hypothetical protein